MMEHMRRIQLEETVGNIIKKHEDSKPKSSNINSLFALALMSKNTPPPQAPPPLAAAPVFSSAAYPQAASLYAPQTAFPAAGVFPTMAGGFPMAGGYPPVSSGGIVYVAVPVPTPVAVPAPTGANAPNLFYGQNPTMLGPVPFGHQAAGGTRPQFMLGGQNPYGLRNFVVSAVQI
jgi:hypothetical protein